MTTSFNVRTLALLGGFSALLILTGIVTPHAQAAIPDTDFSLEVSPTTLVDTVKPGSKTVLELKVHNASNKREQLKIEPRSFSVKNGSDVQLDESVSQDLKEWVRFSDPTFTLEAGAWFTQKITVNLPEEAGFSYPFAVVISRVNENTTPNQGQQLKASVAVFALLNIDKPGATRKLEITKFTPTQKVYEFLPTTLELELKNTGNSIVQPYGNIYIQRTKNSTNPLAVLPVNETKGYTLPNTTRTLTTTWDKGFPRYVTDANGNKDLRWDWSTLSNLRIGKYTAKVVAVYNDGQRDTPLITETSFWVIPWRILGVLLIVVAILGAGVWVIVRKLIRISAKFRS